MSSTPKPPEAPKEVWWSHNAGPCVERKPAPTPEPKQGSEEPPPLTTPATPGGPAIDWKRADKWAIEYEDDWAPGATPNAARAYLALRAEVERLRRRLEVLESGHGRSVNSDPQP